VEKNISILVITDEQGLMVVLCWNKKGLKYGVIAGVAIVFGSCTIISFTRQFCEG